MTRITRFNPPPAIATLLQDTLNVNRATKFASASAYPTSRKLKPAQPQMRWSNPLNMGHVADWLIQFGLIHLQGSISATAEESGLKLWFTPVAEVNFFSYQSTADGYRESIAENWAFLYDGNLSIPPTNLGWSHTQPVDLVFQLGANLANGWSKTTAWMNLKLGTRAPCGVYRAGNAWAECRVDLNVRVYRPSFLT